MQANKSFPSHAGTTKTAPNSSPSQLCASGLQNSTVPVIFSHASFLTDDDQKTLRENDLFVSITPESEAHYGHGQTTGSQITDKASLGIDTNWTFSGDILSQARFWLQHVRLTNYQHTLVSAGQIPNANPFPVTEAFLMATRQGGRALHRDDIGVVQVGAKADLVVFTGDSPNMLGWSDAVAAVVLHANPGDVEHVLVDGEFRKRDFRLVDDGGHTGWNQVRRRFVEAARRIQSQMADPPSLGERLWGVSEFGDVERVSTRPPCGCS